MGSTLIDGGPFMVRGAIRARFARVIWSDGTLYVVSRRQGKIDRQTVAATEPTPPPNPQGYWRAVTDEGLSISFTRKGCGG